MRAVRKFLCLAIISLSLNCASGDTRYCNEGLGECTEFAWCSNSTVFNDGGGHINVRFNIELETDACHYMEMCCDPEDVIKNKNEREIPPVAKSPHREIVVDTSSRNPEEQTDNGINGNAPTKGGDGLGEIPSGGFDGSSGDGKINPTETDVTHTNNGGPSQPGPSGSGPSGSGPSVSRPSGSGPSGSGPSVNGPSVSGPSGSGPSVSGPGPSGSGPSVSGPGSSVLGPSVLGPSVSGPSGSGPSGSGPSGSGPSGSGPSVSGPSGSGPSGSGPSVAGPSGSGPSGSWPSGSVSGPSGSAPTGSGPFESDSSHGTESIHVPSSGGGSKPSGGETHSPILLPVATDNDCDHFKADCVPFFYCETDTTTDGAGMFASRISNEECSIKSQICCLKDKNIIIKPAPGCGHRNENGLGFQVTNNVDEAQYAEFPWMAALSTNNADGSSNYICGGSLIHPNVILTSAHCVHNKAAEMLTARLGEWDTQTTREIFPHSDHHVSKIIMHEEFGKVNLFNDVALLVLKNQAQLSTHVNTICLPPQDMKLNMDTCYASGWGADKFGMSGLYRVNLKKLKLPIVPLRDCQDSLRSSKLGPRFKLHTSFMCAGGEKDVDTCTGDGGSPLVCSHDGETGTFYQVGAVAWGMECGQEGLPGVYASIAKFRNWIDAKMSELGFDASYYTPKAGDAYDTLFPKGE